MKPEDLLQIRTWGDFALNPEGTRAFLVESGIDVEANRATTAIVEWNWDNGTWRAGRQFTKGTRDAHPAVSPNGKWLGFLSARQEGPKQLWMMPLDGGEAYQVTHLKGGVKDFSWHPDSHRAVLVAPVDHGLLEWSPKSPDPKPAVPPRVIDRQFYKLDGTGFFGKNTDQLVMLDVDSEQVELVSGGTLSYANPQFSTDGSLLYYLRSNPEAVETHPGERDLWQYNLKTRQHQRLTDWHWTIQDYQWNRDDSGCAVVLSKPQDMGYGNTELWYWDKNAKRALSESLDRPIGDSAVTDVPVSGPTRPIFSPDQETIYALVSSEGAVHLWEFPVDAEKPAKALTHGHFMLYGFACQNQHWLLGLADSTHPSGIAAEPIPDLPVEWAPTPWDLQNLPTPTEFWATSDDGTTVQAWVLRPEGPGPWPTVLEIHGGPMMMYGWRYVFEFHWLLSQGYAVVYSNPRGSVGYGQAFCGRIIGQWGDRDYADLTAVLDQALERFSDLDATRLGVAGGSYGGFMVNWMLGHTERFRAGITMRSVVNRFSAMGSSDMGWLRVPQYGTKPWWEEPEPYWDQSPLKYASAIRTPLLIEHQAEDQRLPVEQGEQLYSALKYLGREVRMVIYPEESHGMSRSGKPSNRVHRLKTHAAWWRKYL